MKLRRITHDSRSKIVIEFSLWYLVLAGIVLYPIIGGRGTITISFDWARGLVTVTRGDLPWFWIRNEHILSEEARTAAARRVSPSSSTYTPKRGYEVIVKTPDGTLKVFDAFFDRDLAKYVAKRLRDFGLGR